MNLMWNETVFIFPFSNKMGLRKWNRHFEECGLQQYWKSAKDIDSKYFLTYVYNDENRPKHYEYITEELGWNCGDTLVLKTTLTDTGEPIEYTTKLVGLSLFVFPTGVGFVTLRIRYGDNESIKNIANFSAAFSRIYANENEDGSGKVVCYIGEKQFSFKKMIKILVGDKQKEQPYFFPCSNQKKAFVFHRLIQNSLEEREKVALRRNLWVTDESEDVDVVTELESIVQIDDSRYYMLSATVMCVVSKVSCQKDGEARRLQQNIRFSYFNLYLLCIHEQQGIILYNQDEVAIGKKIVNAKKIKKDLLRFLPSYSFCVISTEIVYQQMFLSLQRILSLRELENNLRENISMLETAYEQERDGKMNMILGIIAILGLVSILTDFIQLLSFF